MTIMDDASETSPRLRRRLLLILGGLIVVNLVVDVLVLRRLREARLEQQPANARVDRGPGPRLPPVTLVDQYGRPFRFGDAPPRWSFVFFGFTTCPDVCPAGLTQLAEAWRMLEAGEPTAAARGRVVLVSIDPADDPARMRSFVGRFHPGFVGLGGSEADITALASAAGIFIDRDPAGLAHSGAVLVVDPGQQVVRAIVPPFDADELLSVMRRTLAF